MKQMHILSSNRSRKAEEDNIIPKKKKIKKMFALTVGLLAFSIFTLTEPRNIQALSQSDQGLIATRRMSFFQPKRNRRPVMHTFYTKVKDGEDALLDVWATEWEKAGFDTKVLTLQDAKKHRYYKKMKKVIEPLFGEKYNALCFYRWLAMVQEGGGWMSDYDTFPTNFPIHEGNQLPNGGRFTSFQGHVPALMSGNKNEWLRVTRLLIEAIPKAEDELGLPSDMHAFYILRSEGGHGIQFGKPERNVPSGFLYKKPGKVKCKKMKDGRAIHFSHYRTHQAYLNGLFPIDLPRDSDPSKDYRAQGTSIFMDHWREQCHKEILEMKENPHQFFSIESS